MDLSNWIAQSKKHCKKVLSRAVQAHTYANTLFYKTEDNNNKSGRK